MQVGDYVSAAIPGRSAPFYGHVLELLEGGLVTIQPDRGRNRTVQADTVRPAQGSTVRVQHVSLCLWLTDEERDRWQARASAEGLALSTWTRNIVRRAINDHR